MSSGPHQALFEPDLLKDEKIFWTGQPDPSVHFNKADRFLIPFSLYCAAFIGLMSYYFFVAEFVSWYHFIFLIYFSPYGFYLLIGRFIFKTWRKRHTYYALTSHRALILNDGHGRILFGVFLDHIAGIRKSVRSSGVGTVIFGKPPRFSNFHGNTGMDWQSILPDGGVPAFFDVRDADGVYDLTKKLIQGRLT